MDESGATGGVEKPTKSATGMALDERDPTPPLSNERVARMLEEVADLLDSQGANPFRAHAYRNAASTVRNLASPMTEIARAGGIEALDNLPHIGPRLAGAILEAATRGRLGLLDRLRGEATPERLFSTVAGIGPELAARIHEELGIETLEELELAAHDGRLASVPGFGRRRVQAIVEALAGRFGRRRPVAALPAVAAPAVAELLAVDREYRQEAGAGRLRRIAPRRFNPEHRAWLPVLHTERAGRHYTALFSNTARAHARGRTDDWVVIYLEDGSGDRQATVVTETRGALAGRRVVRGREHECAEYYGLLAGA